MEHIHQKVFKLRYSNISKSDVQPCGSHSKKSIAGKQDSRGEDLVCIETPFYDDNKILRHAPLNSLNSVLFRKTTSPTNVDSKVGEQRKENFGNKTVSSYLLLHAALG